MQLYGSTYSGYTQKVHIALAEKRLTASIPFTLSPRDDPARRLRHPLGLVPVLALGDGTFLTESTPIIEYLDAFHPEPPLIPSEPLQRARMHALDHFNDQALTPAVRQLWHLGFPDSRHSPHPEGDDAAQAAIGRVFTHLEQELGDLPYLVGTFSIADIAFMARLQILPRLGIAPPANLLRVQRWASRLAARPSWAATMYPA